MDRELLLLGLLRQQNMHGYKLIEFLEGELSICTDLKKPTAYFLLDKMAQQGWITRSESQEGNRPVRQVFSITAAGEEIFQKLLRETLSSYSTAKFAADIALAFADALPAEEILALLEQKRVALVADLEAIRAAPRHAGMVQFLIEHRQFHLESEMRWMDQLMERIRTSGHEK